MTDRPRMLTELHRASRRNVPIVVFNRLRERALERFAVPQDPLEMATLVETRIASEYCQVRNGGDVAALKGVMKLILEANDEALRSGAERVIDLDLIAQHTHGFEALCLGYPSRTDHMNLVRNANGPHGASSSRFSSDPVVRNKPVHCTALLDCNR